MQNFFWKQSPISQRKYNIPTFQKISILICIDFLMNFFSLLIIFNRLLYYE